jgi:hypothetical protein
MQAPDMVAKGWLDGANGTLGTYGTNRQIEGMGIWPIASIGIVLGGIDSDTDTDSDTDLGRLMAGTGEPMICARLPLKHT